MVSAFLICFSLPSSGLNAFIGGFLGVGLVWMGQALNLDVQNESSFSVKIAEIMQMGDSFDLILLTGAIGGLSGGLAAISGVSFKRLTTKTKKKGLYS